MKKFLIVSVTVLFVALSLLAPKQIVQAQQSTLTPAQKGEFEKLIKEYILANPEIILEAIQALRVREKNNQVATDRKLITQHKDALLKDANSVIAGNLKGDVTVVEFFDYRCGYCKQVSPMVTKLLAQDKNVRIVYKEFPILGPASRFAAEAALASRVQGKYRKFHESLMAAKGNLTKQRVLRIAEQVGLERSKLVAEMASQKVKNSAIIRQNMQLASALKITGTPAFIVGDVIVRGALSLQSLQDIVQTARQAAK